MTERGMVWGLRTDMMARWMFAGLMVVCCGGGFAQVTTGTVAADDGVTATVAVEGVSTGSTVADVGMTTVSAESTQTVVLIGEKVGLDNESPRQAPFPELKEIAGGVLGGTIVDYTAVGQTIAETAAQVGAVGDADADVVVIFAGFSDEREDVEEDEIRAGLEKLMVALREANPAMRVFLAPAATNVGTLTSANMRLVASEFGATFVVLGTEVGGQPYRDAFAEVAEELESGEVVLVEPPAQEPVRAVTIRGGQVEEADASTETLAFHEQKANLQEELSRIAGESGDVQAGLPGAEETSVAAFLRADDGASTAGEGMTYPEGGILTKRGAEARENINMRPLPAVKAFRPQYPVPRNEINVKEPALSR